MSLRLIDSVGWCSLLRCNGYVITYKKNTGKQWL